MTNKVGINKNQALLLNQSLNDLLSNFQIYYQNLRGFHWNIKGNNFFELHAKFELLYTESNLAIDQIAERILTLGGKPLHAFSDFLEEAEIKEAKNLHTAVSTVETTIANLAVLLKKEREILSLAQEAQDEGTANLMGDYISAQEKEVWMLSSFNYKD